MLRFFRAIRAAAARDRSAIARVWAVAERSRGQRTLLLLSAATRRQRGGRVEAEAEQRAAESDHNHTDDTTRHAHATSAASIRSLP